MSLGQNMALVLFGGMAVSSALADMTIAGYSSARHDRFYAGSDRAFLGETMDWSGVGRSINTATSHWATMISPSFFVSANHFHANVGDTVRFYYSNDPNGGYEERTVIDGSHIGSSDVWVGRLASSVGSRVTKYALAGNASLPSESIDPLIGQKMWQFGLNSDFKYVPWCRQAVGRNIITASNSYGIMHPYEALNQYGTLGQDEANAVLGDSGSPAFVTVDGKPVFVAERYTPTYSGSVAYLTDAIQSYISFSTSAQETICTIAIPAHTTVPVIRETFQSDSIGGSPKGSDQTIQMKKTGLITVVGSGESHADPFGGSDNKSLKMQTTSSQTSSSLFMEGLQTGVVQGQWLMDFQTQAPSSPSDNGLFTLSLGHDYYGDQALDDPSGSHAETNLKMTLQANGRLNIQSNGGMFVSDQALEFDEKHHVQVLWRYNGTGDAYGDILIDGQRITSSNGAVTRFSLQTLGNTDLDRVDSAYLAMNWTDGFDDSVVYFDNLFLLDIPEPASMGIGMLVGMMIWRRQRLH